MCHCQDCRAAEMYLGQPDPVPSGVDLFQTTPDAIQLENSTKGMSVLRLGPKGPLRWYATCCKAPMFNTLSRAGIPFSTVLVARLSEPTRLGPIIARAFVPQPGGAPNHKGAGRMVWRMVSNMAAARLSGRWRQTPFFDLSTGSPTAPVHLLTKEERIGLYK